MKEMSTSVARACTAARISASTGKATTFANAGKDTTWLGTVNPVTVIPPSASRSASTVELAWTDDVSARRGGQVLRALKTRTSVRQGSMDARTPAPTPSEATSAIVHTATASRPTNTPAIATKRSVFPLVLMEDSVSEAGACVHPNGRALPVRRTSMSAEDSARVAKAPVKICASTGGVVSNAAVAMGMNGTQTGECALEAETFA